MVDKHEGEHLQHVQLKYLIDEYFSRDDLRSLCFNIGVDFDHLREAGKLIQIEELLLICLHRGLDQALLAELVRVRPNVTWPTHYSIFSIFPALDALRNDALNHAKFITDRKSRILKPQGELPKLQNLFVTFHDKNINYRFSKKGDFEPEERLPPPMLLSEVIKRDQRILLMGDLGTGKSTMVGLFVNEITTTNPKALALMVPASANVLKVPTRATIQDVLNGVSAYLNNHISIRTPPIEFRNLLDTEIPIYVIIDGLDEIPSRQAASLLSLLYETTSHYPNLWVVTTGRPVELRGVNHQNWQIVTPLPLQDNEKLQLFQAEGVANGLSSKDAKKGAEQLLTKLKNIPTLNSLATTPLTTRLLYNNRLLTTQFDSSATLGDLLYDLLQERLGRWAQSDQKAHTFEYFEKEFPDELARISLFGEFALHMEMAENLPIEQARLYLRGLLEPKVSEKTDILAKEAVEYLIQSGIAIIEDNQLRYAIQPLFEFLTGFGLAERWIGKHSTPEWLQLQHWRIVSFAGTVIRRLGAINELRSQILNYLGTLLVTERNIPAACYIIVELQDEECAIAFIDHLNQMGMRPLTYFGDEKEQSTRAIATTIKLAGNKGFDWFYEHYLDPRYPIIHTASGLLDDVFEQWVYISQNSITDYERTKLQKLVRPHIAANTHQTYTLLPALAILIPGAFTPKERLWMIKKYLGRSPFSAQAETYFIQEFQKGNERLVNSALLQIANQGHEMAKSAAWLWLSLNPDERPHALILKTLLSAYGRSYLDIGRKEYLTLCEDRVGKKQWHQFLRWCLFHKNDRLAAGAAIELNALGETRLSILGKPLLEAMHDGGYFKLAEEALHQTVKTSGSVAVHWLANQIAATIDGYDSAHSGWWRILLSELPSVGHNGPDLLANCVGGVGPFLLPRYPDVRLLFRNLLSGTDGARYRVKLQGCLNHINPAIRHGASMVLVACNPNDEPIALEYVVRLRQREKFGSWHEWESFCLNLSFSPQVLEHLQEILSTLEASTKVFALALLYRNRIDLTPEEYADLVTNLLKVGNRSLDVYDPELSVFADPQSFSILVEILDQGSDAEVAAQLLNYHSSQLSPSLKIKCISLLASIPSWPGNPNLHEQLKKLENDPDYDESVKDAMEEIVNGDKPVPILELLRQAIADENKWDTVVWRLLCDDSNLGLSLEDNGQWLLDFGRLESKYRIFIGASTQKFLKDPRIQNSRRSEIKQWLAILADEFVGISEEELRDALVTQGQPVWHSAASSLIARLGSTELPELNIRQMSNSIPKSFDEFERTPQTAEALKQQLEEALRPSEELYPETCEIIEEICLTPIKPEISFTLSAEGVSGILILSALSYVLGNPPNPDFVLPILSTRRTPTQMNNQCFNRLLDIWRYGQRLAIHEDNNLRETCIELLHRKLSEVSDTFDTFAIGSELLLLRSLLTAKELEQILSPYVHYTESDDFSLNEQFVHFFTSQLPPDTQTSYIPVLEQAIEALDAHSWDKNSKAAYRFLILPLAFWKLSNRNTVASNRVFLRGLKAAFSLPSGGTYEQGPIEILGEISPLFSSVPEGNIKHSLLYGRTLKDPIVRNICQLFSLDF